MKNYINIKNRREALDALNKFKEKNYNMQIVRLDNVELRRINYYLKHQIFRQNDLYVDATTLFELMQPVGGKGIHNYHGLTPDQILNVLNKIAIPYCIYQDGAQKYAVITSELVENLQPIMVVIAIELDARANIVKEINKVVTMFPKNDVDSFLKNMPQEKILYKSVYK